MPLYSAHTDLGRNNGYINSFPKIFPCGLTSLALSIPALRLRTL